MVFISLKQQTTQLPPMKLRQLLLYLKYFMLLPEIVEQDAIGGGRAAEGDKHTAARHHQDHGVQTLPVPASLACCVFVSDPDTALMPELPFPKVMLTDRSARATLFSATHTLVTTSPIRELFPSPTASSRKSIRPGHTTLAPANSVGNSRSLLELLTPRKVDAETIVSPPATEPSPEGARKVRYTRDLDCCIGLPSSRVRSRMYVHPDLEHASSYQGLHGFVPSPVVAPAVPPLLPYVSLIQHFRTKPAF